MNHSTNTTLNFKDSLLLRSPQTHKFVSSVAKKYLTKDLKEYTLIFMRNSKIKIHLLNNLQISNQHSSMK